MSLPLDDIPACRHAEGTISSSSVLDVWRMASEDSDQILSGFAPVHGLSYLRNLDESVRSQMTARRDHVDALCEFLKVLLL